MWTPHQASSILGCKMWLSIDRLPIPRSVAKRRKYWHNGRSSLDSLAMKLKSWVHRTTKPLVSVVSSPQMIGRLRIAHMFAWNAAHISKNKHKNQNKIWNEPSIRQPLLVTSSSWPVPNPKSSPAATRKFWSEVFPNQISKPSVITTAGLPFFTGAMASLRGYIHASSNARYYWNKTLCKRIKNSFK